MKPARRGPFAPIVREHSQEDEEQEEKGLINKVKDKLRGQQTE